MISFLRPMQRAIMFVTALMACIAPSAAQIPDKAFDQISGTTYVVAFPDTTGNTFDIRYPDRRFENKTFLFIYSAVDNRVNITGRGYSRTDVMLAGGRFEVIDLGQADARAPAPIVFEHCKPVNNTFRIAAEQPVVIYQYMVTTFGAEAWSALPVEAWGTRYYAAAHPGEIGSDISPGGEFDYNRKNKMFPAEILVIAAYDDTKITIIPTATVHTFCNSTNVTLKAGEAYQIQSLVDTLTANMGTEQGDFGGSRIVSTKPVGVISGNTRAQLIDENVGLGKNIFKNMLVEWLTPVDMHGTEFVYMPTVDSRMPTRAPTEDPSEKRKAEFVRLYATSDGSTSGSYIDSIDERGLDMTMESGKFYQRRVKPTITSAALYRTTQPAQAMMTAAAVVKYGGTTNGFGGYIGAAYDGWGGYMVEMTPRERWASFSPFYAPAHVSGMEHYINVATDSAHRSDVYLANGTPFVFNRSIAGTDIVWGSMSVVPGVDNHLEGRNGARFYAYVYGTLSKGGHEEYRPGQARDNDVPPDGVHHGGANDVVAMHPSEYEERVAIAYAYPVASMLYAPSDGDSLRIETSMACGEMTIRVTSVNQEPVGLRSLRLEDPINAKIRSMEPLVLTGATNLRVVLTPVDVRRSASATVVIKDRSGKITRVPYSFEPENLDVPDTVHFIGLKVDTPATRTVTVTNTTAGAATIRSLGLRTGTAFSIIDAPAMPLTLGAGQTLAVTVRVLAAAGAGILIDTLAIALDCTVWRVALRAVTAEPCLTVGNLDFGTLEPGQTRTLPLKICNEGGGVVTFGEAGSAIAWPSGNYRLSTADIELLKNAQLAEGECITISVSFTADSVGQYSTTARLNANTRSCRDTSVWSARVLGPSASPMITGALNSLSTSEPNPFLESTSIAYTLARGGHASLVVYNSRGERVATLVDGVHAAGSYTAHFDASRLPAGVYHYRLSVDGWSQTRTMIRR